MEDAYSEFVQPDLRSALFFMPQVLKLVLFDNVFGVSYIYSRLITINRSDIVIVIVVVVASWPSSCLFPVLHLFLHTRSLKRKTLPKATQASLLRTVRNCIGSATGLPLLRFKTYHSVNMSVEVRLTQGTSFTVHNVLFASHNG
jgi:hypothetical protein